MKKRVKNAEDLALAIAELELIAAAQKKDIQETYKSVSENLKPLNMLKNGVRSVFSGEYQEDIFNALLGLGSGFLGRRLLLGSSRGMVGKSIGKAIQWGLAGLVSKNAEKIKEKAGEFIDRFFKKHKTASTKSPAFPVDEHQIHP